MTQRIALRVAFDGGRYHGTQRQPNVATVNDAILTALQDADRLAPEPQLRAQGRLDAGVSARDYVLALNVEGPLKTAARIVAGRTDAIVPWAGARVHATFDPRFATRTRTYRYHVPSVENLDTNALRAAWDLFQGSHDFGAFARIVPDQRQQEPVRRIHSTYAHQRTTGVDLEATAPTFLRHQVRRMVGASLAVARGELAHQEIREALAGGKVRPVHVAPAEGLTLWRVALSADWAPLTEAEAVGRSSLNDRVARIQQLDAALGAVRSPTQAW